MSLICELARFSPIDRAWIPYFRRAMALTMRIIMALIVNPSYQLNGLLSRVAIFFINDCTLHWRSIFVLFCFADEMILKF